MSYTPVPPPSDAQHSYGYGSGAAEHDFAATASSTAPSHSAVMDGGLDHDGAFSNATTAVTPSRSNTLKKKSSIRRTASLKRSSSKKSLRAGSIRSVKTNNDASFNSVFHTPIPTQGSPTEILADRFQAWRQLLKSLITYFREIQASYEARAKAVHKVQNTISNIVHPAIFVSENGISEAARILDDYHKRSINEATKSREIENDVIGALTGLRSDLGQKIKEIKSLGGDFKNSVEKEKENTRKEVEKLQDALQHAAHEDGAATGKNDPFVVRLGVDRAVERQIDEENYLHRAYLNLESSGRELESIVVGEIQKAYNALAGILKREGDDAHHAVEALRSGPIAMPKDLEWREFVENDPHFVDPSVPLRRVEDIEYPGKSDPSATEVRSGMLERKSKYLKSYTAGWYVLSPTHLHEFKSADKIYSQPPVMSLPLNEQKLGSKSEQGSSSHKFMLKGKQSGSMHKGHNWVFRAESHDTMLAWFEDIRILTEETGEKRNAFVRRHARSVSGTSDRGTVSSDGFEEDEADAVPYSADAASLSEPVASTKVQRPQPGGRFPSDLRVPQSARAVVDDDSEPEQDTRGDNPYRLDGVRASFDYPESVIQQPQATYVPELSSSYAPPQSTYGSVPQQQYEPIAQQPIIEPQHSQPADILVPAAAGVAAGALGTEAFKHHQEAAEAPDATATPIKEPLTEPTPAFASIPETLDTPTAPSAVAPTSSNNVLLAGSTGLPSHPAPATTTTTTTTATSADTPVVPAASTASAEAPLGGNEAEGAHETGRFFPRVVRHDTNLSISKLHVPGEFPNKTGGGQA